MNMVLLGNTRDKWFQAKCRDNLRSTRRIKQIEDVFTNTGAICNDEMTNKIGLDFISFLGVGQ
uniref:Uncharacterized protein n=1 Tax=Romanomermis culicivorax TaxID=13658 RepID=A0A915K4Q2_ROMCU